MDYVLKAFYEKNGDKLQEIKIYVTISEDFLSNSGKNTLKT
jgi:hypothetical protein